MKPLKFTGWKLLVVAPNGDVRLSLDLSGYDLSKPLAQQDVIDSVREVLPE